MLQKCPKNTTVGTQDDSSRSGQAPAPPPYSQVSGVGNSANSSESLSQLLDKRNVFQIRTVSAIWRQVVDGNGTPVLSILRQPLSGMDWQIRTLFLNSTGKPVLEMTRIIDDKDAAVFDNTWTIYEGGRIAGILRDLEDYDEPELVGYRISGKEMFRSLDRAHYSLTVREDGKELAVITKGDNRGPTSLTIFNPEVDLELKALLLCSAVYYDGWGRHLVKPAGYVSGGCEIAERSKGSTNRPGTKGSNHICGALDMAIRVVLFLILIIFLLFLPFILMKAT